MNATEPAAPQALDLLEEAVHMLRLAPPRFFLPYYLGSVPFVLGLLYFYTAMRHSAFAAEYSTRAAFGLACLLVWMQSWQAVFAAQLRQHLTGNSPGPWPWGRGLRLLMAQTAIAPWAWVVLPASALLFLPWARACAFFHNITVLGDGTGVSLQTLCSTAYQQARLWPRQNMLLLLVLGLFRLGVFINVGFSLAMLPYLLKTLLGIDTVFSRHMGSMLNVTFLLTAWGMTSLCVGPLLKAVYVLRCFYGESLYSGADLQATLKGLRLARPAGGVLLGVLVILSLSAGAGAQESPARPVPDLTPQLDRAIGEVLQQREYVWRMPRPYTARPPAAMPLFPGAYERLKTWLKILGKWFGQVIDWLKELLFPSPGQEIPRARGTPRAAFLLWITGLAVLVLLCALGWWLWYRRRRVASVPATVAMTVATSLADERLSADVLPAPEWVSLAQHLWQQGEWRLAMRALHLASLAYLAEHHLLSISAAKSNREYARELARRAHTRPQLLAAFAQNISTFERVWYGTHPASDELLRQFHHTYERMQTCVDA